MLNATATVVGLYCIFQTLFHFILINKHVILAESDVLTRHDRCNTPTATIYGFVPSKPFAKLVYIDITAKFESTYAKESTMVKVILTLAVVAAIGTLSGCEMLGDAVRHVRTPDAEICKKTMGLSIADAEENLDMGKADSVNNKKTGDQIRSYTKGNLKAELTIDAVGKVIEADCEHFKTK
jgi:hypothetical protein